MNHSHFDIKQIAKQLIDNCIIDDNDKYEGIIQDDFKSDYDLFIFCKDQYFKGFNKEVNLEYMIFFFNEYPASYQPGEVIKAVESLQAAKADKMIKELDMSDEDDIKVYIKVIEMRNELLKKHKQTLSK